MFIKCCSQHECLAAHHNSRWCSYPAHGTAPRPPEDANITSFKWRHPWQSKNTIHHLIIHQKSSKHLKKKEHTKLWHGLIHFKDGENVLASGIWRRFFSATFLRELPELFLNLDSGPPSEFLPHFSLQQPVASGKLTLCYANHEFTVVWKGDLHSYVKLLVWRKPWKGVRFYESWLLVMDIPWYFIRFLY